MKIVVWNCRMALARKCQPLYDLHPDIAVIPECSQRDMELSRNNQVDARWFGDNPRKGLGVLVAKPLRITRAEKPPNRWVVPLSICGGPCDFRLIAVWAMPVKGSVVKSYIGQVYEALTNNPQWFPTKPRSHAPVEAGLQPRLSSSDSSLRSVSANPKPVILCGDFNSNKLWDDHRKTGNHSAVVRLLEKRGLLSAYHHFFSEPQGHETRPTYYFWHRKTRGYHIDYVFLPRAWASRIQSVQVGPHSDWSHLSDHVPLCVDLTLPAP